MCLLRGGLTVIDDSARTIDGFHKGRLGQLADITVFSFESKTPHHRRV